MVPILEAELIREPTPRQVTSAKDPLEVLASTLLRVKVNLSGDPTEEVRFKPPRLFWIKQLRSLIRGR